MFFMKRLFEGMALVLLAIWLLAVVYNLIRRLCRAIREWWWFVDLSTPIGRARRAMNWWWFWRRQAINDCFRRLKAD